MKSPDIITALEQTKPSLHNRDFLLTWDQSDDDLRAVLAVAEY